MIFFIVLSLARLGLYFYRKLEIGKNPVYLAAALIGLVLVTYTGHLGGKMVHRDMSNMMQGEPGGPGGQGAPGGGQPIQNQQQNGPRPSNNGANNGQNNVPTTSPK